MREKKLNFILVFWWEGCWQSTAHHFLPKKNDPLVTILLKSKHCKVNLFKFINKNKVCYFIIALWQECNNQLYPTHSLFYSPFLPHCLIVNYLWDVINYNDRRFLLTVAFTFFSFIQKSHRFDNIQECIRWALFNMFVSHLFLLCPSFSDQNLLNSFQLNFTCFVADSFFL